MLDYSIDSRDGKTSPECLHVYKDAFVFSLKLLVFLPTVLHFRLQLLALLCQLFHHLIEGGYYVFCCCFLISENEHKEKEIMLSTESKCLLAKYVKT